MFKRITAHILVTIVPRMYAVTYIGKPMCIAFQASLSCPIVLSVEPNIKHILISLIFNEKDKDFIIFHV